MNNPYLKIGIRFVLLTLVQVFLVDHFNLFNGLSAPFIYPLILFYLPVSFSPFLAIIIGLISGLTIDMFSNTIGMHASAMVFVAFLRKHVLSLMAPRDGYENNLTPTMGSLGFTWFITYISIMMIAHHVWLFNLENFQFSGFWNTQLRVLLSVIISIVLAVLLEFITFRSSSKR